MKRFLSVMLSAIVLLSCFSGLTITSASASSVVESAIDWAVAISNDADGVSHLYSQSVRWGPSYDCSSLVISAFKHAGVDTGASWTGDMQSLFTKHGFTWIPWSQIGGVSNLQRGDVLLYHNASTREGHTEIYLGNNQNVGAHSANRPAADQISVSGYYFHPWDGVLRYTQEPVNDSTPKMKSTRFEYFNNGVRPVIEIENPSSISNVIFYLRFGATAEWKSYSGKFNLDKAWYCEASYDELNGTGDIVCHVYVYGEDGSKQCFVIEKPCVESSRCEFFNNGIRPVVEIKNPSSISNITFYLRFGKTAEWKSYSGKYNLDKAWYCEAPYNELNGSGELVCDVYIDGKDGSHKYMSIDTKTEITNIKEKRVEYFNNGVRPVVTVSNHSKVSKVTFYLRYGTTAKWKSYSGSFNLADSWYCEALLNDLAGEGQLVCDIYVDYIDGIHQYVGFPIDICKHSYDDGVVTKEATCTSNGVKTYTCSYCSSSYTETITAKGHKEVITKGYEATCTDDGLTDSVHCSVCKEVLTKSVAIYAKGHSAEKEWVTISTSEVGKVTQVKRCTDCGAVVETREIAKNDTTPSVATDPTEPSAETQPSEEVTKPTIGTDPTESTANTDPTEETSMPETELPTATDPVESNVPSDSTSPSESIIPEKPSASTEPSTNITEVPSEPTNPVENEGFLGDANGDGKVNVKDATAIQKHIASIAVLSDAGIVLADATGDGRVNIKDATAIQKYAAGIETGLPIGKSKII